MKNAIKLPLIAFAFLALGIVLAYQLPLLSKNDASEEIARLNAKVDALTNQRLNTANTEQTMPHPGSGSAEIDHVHANLANIKQKLNRMDKGQKELEKKVEMSTSTGTSESNYGTHDHESDRAQQQLRIEQGMHTIDEAFYDQEPDPGWSQATQDNVQNALQQANLEGHQLSHVECRTSLCQLQLQHSANAEDPGDSIGLVRDALVENMGENAEGFYNTVQQPDGSSTTTVYITKSGESLPWTPGKDQLAAGHSGPDH